MTGQLGEALGLLFLGGAQVAGDPVASDVLTLVDTASATTDSQYSVDSIVLIDTASRTVTYDRSSSDVITLADTATGFRPLLANDSITLTDSAVGLIIKKAGDTLSLTDTPGLQLSFRRSVSDVVETFEAASVSIRYRRSASDTLTLVETAVGKASREASDTIVFTETTTSVVSKGARDTLTFTDGASTAKTVGRSAADTITFVESNTRSLTLNRSASDNLTIVDSASGGKLWTTSATDNIAFTEEVFRQRFSVVNDETLVYTDAASRSVTRTRSANDSLTLGDSTQVNVTINVSASDNLVFRERSFPYKDGSGVILNGQGSLMVLPSPEFNDYQSHQGKMIVKRSMAGRHRTLTKTTTRDKLNWRFVIAGGKKLELEKFVDREINNDLIVTDWEGRQWSFKLSMDTYDYTELARWKPGGNKFEVTLEFEGTRYYG